LEVRELDDALNAGADDGDASNDLLTERPPNIVIASQDLKDQLVYIRKDIFDRAASVAGDALALVDGDVQDDAHDELVDELEQLLSETGV
jgi:hypothetical protein